MIKLTRHSHFSSPRYYSTQGGDYWVGFTLGQCEHCNGPIQEPNSLNYHEPRARLESLGMTHVPVLPPEIGHSDVLGYSACDACWDTIPADEA